MSAGGGAPPIHAALPALPPTDSLYCLMLCMLNMPCVCACVFCCLRSTESDVKHAHREIMNHQRLLHPHVVQLKEVRLGRCFAGLFTGCS